ncbi:MAG: cyanoexosortase A system-associated protein [Prochlorotrichaceae cyanobacterium]|jgi:cyanosortase A-associated protein
MKTPWPEKLRLLILGILLLAGAGVLVKIIFTPKSTELQAQPQITLPNSVPLSSGTLFSSRSLSSPFDQEIHSLADQAYQYQIVLEQNFQLQPTLQVHYIVRSTGDVKRYVKQAFSLPSQAGKSELKHNLFGDYLQILESDQLQFSTCLDPYGRSTVSIRDYQGNRNFRDIRYRLLPWLLGAPLKDERCLFTTLTIALEPKDLPTLEPPLESLWQDWCQWWINNFPEYRSQEG